MKIRLSVSARRDLRDILIDLASDNPAAALALDARLTERFQQLSRFPEMGRPRLDISPPTRGLLVSPYVVFYRVMPPIILVVRVLHSSRDLRQADME